ncbi:membrane protein [Bacilli bacterium PM5-3]|nr:membrane protein [Bacilli bacterium PM5-3]
MKKLVLKTIALHTQGEYKWIPSSLAFYLFISFIPLLFSILLIAIKYTNIDINALAHVVDINAFESLITNLITHIKGNFGNMSLVALIAILLYTLFIASNGITGIIYASNAFFGFEKISIVRNKLLSFLVIIIILSIVILMLFFVSFIPSLFKIFRIQSSYLTTLFAIVPILYLIIHILYFIISDFRLRTKDIYKGALFTTFSITLLLVFSSIIFSGSTTSIIYGSLAILILIGHFFLYVGYCIYIGLALNVANYQLENNS